jgi:putative transposase
MIPNDFPPWSNVYGHFRQWNLRGIWGKVQQFLNKKVQTKKRRSASPTYAIIDSQSVKTQYNSEERGIDGGKLVKGRKRHVGVDILGNMLEVQVHAANRNDTMKGGDICEQIAEKYSSVEAFSGDQGYNGTTKEFVEKVLKLRFEVSKKIKDKFVILPKRWFVERTFAWLGNFRRLAKDFEILTATEENMIRIAMIKIALAKCK